MNPLTEWDDIPLTVKFDFFGTWYGVEIIGEAFVIISQILGLFEDSTGMPISDLSRALLGVGIIILCTNMTKYFEYWKKFYTLVLTLQGCAVFLLPNNASYFFLNSFSVFNSLRSFKRNLRFVLSVVPLFMGFATCGVLVFSPYSSRFESLDQSAISLFALLNGDDVHATFLDLGPRFPYKVFTNLYLFTFCMLFITAILNIFIFIIEDSYHAAKDFISNEADRHSSTPLTHRIDLFSAPIESYVPYLSPQDNSERQIHTQRKQVLICRHCSILWMT
jgi:mucolipin 3